jgi:hypothetical protein
MPAVEFGRTRLDPDQTLTSRSRDPRAQIGSGHCHCCGCVLIAVDYPGYAPFMAYTMDQSLGAGFSFFTNKIDGFHQFLSGPVIATDLTTDFPTDFAHDHFN